VTVALLGFEQLREQPDPRWLIDGLVPDEGLAVMFGASGSGKSFVALDWCLCVASGHPWFGHAIERPGFTVYVAAEGRCGVKPRVEAWWRAHGRPDLTRARFLLDAVNLRNPAEMRTLRDELATLPERPRLLMIDTLARSMPGGDESAARDMGEAIAALDSLQVDVRTIVHHVGHNGSHERGSSALQGAADLRVKIEREARSRQRTLTCEKCKEATEWEPIMLSLDPQPDGSCVFSQVVEVEAKRDELRDEVLAHVHAHGPVSANATAKALRRRRESVLEALRALEGTGTIESSSDGYKVVPRGAEPLRNRSSAAPQAVVPQGGTHPFRGVPTGTTPSRGTDPDREPAVGHMPPSLPTERRNGHDDEAELGAWLAERGYSLDELEAERATFEAEAAERGAE
jgi:hypothetical protein